MRKMSHVSTRPVNWLRALLDDVDKQSARRPEWKRAEFAQDQISTFRAKESSVGDDYCEGCDRFGDRCVCKARVVYAMTVSEAIVVKETKTMKRSAKHIVIKFTVGHERKLEFRMRVGGDVERLATDELDAPIWVKLPGNELRGLPSKHQLLEHALTKIFSDLPPWTAEARMYPDGVEAVGSDIITVNLGNFSA